jgi:hypothetical protein
MEMNEALQGQIGKAIDTLSNKLGVGAEKLWEILLAQTKIVAITSSLELISLIIVIWATVFWTRLVQRKLMSREWVDDSVWIPTGILIFAISLVTLICVPQLISDILTAFLNPEYLALDKILSAVKK